jgi:hypothetical protein
MKGSNATLLIGGGLEGGTEVGVTTLLVSDFLLKAAAIRPIITPELARQQKVESTMAVI